MSLVLSVARLAAIGACAIAVLVAIAGWLVRTRRVSPFSSTGRLLRSLSEPVLRRVESPVVRAGGSPAHAGWWLVIGTAVVAVLCLSALEWVIQIAAQVIGAAAGGPRGLLLLAVSVAYDVLVVALFVRVLGSWFGLFRYARGLRAVYRLTDWVVEPLRRVLPPAAGFDWSPLAAWVVLWLLRQLLFAVI